MIQRQGKGRREALSTPEAKAAVSPTWWDGVSAFLWQKVFQPVAGFLIFLLNGFGHWLPAPWQGRFLVLTHNVQPLLPNLLVIGVCALIAKALPKRWIDRIPSGIKNMGFLLLVLPVGCFMLWAIVTAAASIIYFLTGWSNWQLGFSTMGALVLWTLCWFMGDRFAPDIPHRSHGSAHWQTEEDARNRGRILKKGFVLGNSYGFALGRMDKTPTGHDSRLRYMGHVLTCAPTGAGKGIGAVIPNLLEYPGSALVLDIKGENYAVTHLARAKLKNEVFLIDPFAVTGKTGHAFNWLDILNPDDPNIVSDSAMLADMLVVVDRNQNSHWDDAARDLIQGMLIHVSGFEADERHMGTVRHLLTGGEERLRLVLQEMTETSAGYGLVARAAHGFLIKAERERSGVLSTAIRHTAFLDDPRIVDSMRRSDFDLRDIKRKRMSVFVALPPAKLTAYNRFLRGIVGLTLAAVTHDPIKPEYNVVFFLDEFGQLGRMAAVEDAISLVRGYGVSFWIFVQDLSQLKGVYPKWQTFLANTAKQFFGTADLDTARYISTTLGNYTGVFYTSSQGAQHSSNSEHRHSRPLLSPDEVMRMGAHRPIVLISGESPYLLERLNYLQDKEYQGLAEENPFHAAR